MDYLGGKIKGAASSSCKLLWTCLLTAAAPTKGHGETYEASEMTMLSKAAFQGNLQIQSAHHRRPFRPSVKESIQIFFSFRSRRQLIGQASRLKRGKENLGMKLLPPLLGVASRIRCMGGAPKALQDPAV
jgi:hypothetical protein